MDMNTALVLINQLRDELYSHPKEYYRQKRAYFEYQSFKSSAIEELMMYLIRHKNKNPIDAIEDFRYQMDCFACKTRNGIANFIFSVYYDVVTDVLDQLLTIRRIWNGWKFYIITMRCYNILCR